jgi:SAM-dependent methyltransferase
MRKLTAREARDFWRRNDEAKKDADTQSDPEGLCFGLYDDFPGWINRYYATFQQRVIDRFLQQIDLSAGDRVLEVGCGAGRWCHNIAEQPHRSITGIDISIHRLIQNQAIHSGRINFVNALAGTLPIRSEAMALVFAVTVIHHLPPEVQAQAIAEAYRVLAPGQYFFMLESTEVNSTSDHLYARTSDDWHALLQDSGFTIVDCRGIEFIDFRRIIRPIRRMVRSVPRLFAGRESSDAGDDRAGSSLSAGLSLPEKLFHLPFWPLVLAAYPLEAGLCAWAPIERANYACILARKE